MKRKLRLLWKKIKVILKDIKGEGDIETVAKFYLLQ